MSQPTSKDPVELPSVDGFTCPHRYGCWQREAVRLLLAAIVAAIIAACTHGCQVALRAPGISFDTTPSWPTTNAAATPSALSNVPPINIYLPASPPPPVAPATQPAP